AQRRGYFLIPLAEFVHAYHDLLASFHALLIRVGGVLNFGLDPTPFNRRQRSAHGINSCNVVASALLNLVRESLNVAAAPQRIRSPSNAGFVGNDLLGTKRDPGGLFGG